MEVDGASELLFWKRLLTSNLGRFGVDDDVDGAVEEEAAEVEPDAVDGAVEDADVAAADGGMPVENEVVREWCFPFDVAGTLPNDLIPSGLIVGTFAGEDDIGAEASSIDPKVTDEPGDV